jgi:Sec-independent protein secretion pathway component TatC
VLIVIAGAFLTPGDMVWTTIALSVPLYALYELSVLAATVIYRRKRRRLALVSNDRDDDNDDDDVGRPRGLT